MKIEEVEIEDPPSLNVAYEKVKVNNDFVINLYRGM